ncbi:MAG: hypothetical protein ACOYNY_13565 [Caldilineaceae bacterium]
MANEVLHQPSGIEMVMALLRYITRSAVKLNRTEITQQLLAYLPKEGGFLMETLAQEWIEECRLISVHQPRYWPPTPLAGEWPPTLSRPASRSPRRSQRLA